MIGYGVQVNEEQIREARDLFEFIGGNSRDAIRVAINKAGPKIRTKASAEIRKQVRLSASYVGDKLKFTRATNNNLGGNIATPSRGLLLSKFSTDSSIAADNVSWIKPPPVPARGIRVKIKPGGPAKVFHGDNDTIDKPFYIVLKNSKRLGIAARWDGKGKQGGAIKVFHGPSLSQVFSGVKDDILPEASKEYTEQLIEAMAYLLRMRKPKE